LRNHQFRNCVTAVTVWCVSLYEWCRFRVRDRKKLMNALTVDPLYLQHAQSGSLTALRLLLDSYHVLS